MGRFVQRYYDPAIGRFLSVDPISTNTKIGSNFNRYWYGNDNPYRFSDPDGRYSCDTQTTSKANCHKVEKWLAGLEKSSKKMDKSSEAFQQASAVLAYMGKPNTSNGVWVSAAALGGNALARADPGGSILFDFSRISAKASVLANDAGIKASPVEGALGSSLLAHEGSHSVWYHTMQRGALSRVEHKGIETTAYSLQGQVSLNMGFSMGNLTPEQIEKSAENSTATWCSDSGLCK